MSRSFISAAERSLILHCAQSGTGIEAIPGSTFRFVPAEGARLIDGPPSKRTLSFKRKRHMKNIKTWRPLPLEYGAFDMQIPMRGDSLELTLAREAYGKGDPGPLREWLAAQTFLAPPPKPAYNRTMGPQEFKAIRQRLGLTQSQLAARLRIEDLRTIRRYETGERAISGPVSLLMEQLDHQ